jgi:hypothetical protein
MLIILVAAYRMNPAYSGHGWGRRKKKEKETTWHERSGCLVVLMVGHDVRLVAALV